MAYNTVVKISDYTYNLPQDRIALEPPDERGTSQLLVLHKQTGKIEHRRYHNMIDYLNPGDVVVLNNTKVIKARLLATNQKGQQRELLLLESHASDTNPHVRRCIYKGAISQNEQLTVGNVIVTVQALYSGGTAEIRSSRNILQLAEHVGHVPLPPYIKRADTQSDTERYQTIFSHAVGSVAAPTASLNFTHDLEERLRAKGVVITYLTLHVGLGTFLPIRTDTIEEHIMHSEYFEIPAETIRLIQSVVANGNKICAVGTTVTRTLEYASHKILNGEPADISGEANIFIYPGYEFQVVDMLLTNFHAPKSTVLMLAAAFAGWDNLKNAYDTAIEQKYAFLSYGDSMLIV